MRDINKLYATCSQKLTDIGIAHGNITKLTVNNRAKKRWGRCIRNRNGDCTIEISSMLLNDNVSDIAAETTMLHELLHSCEECYGNHHGSKWRSLASKVNRAYGYNIKRTTSPEEKNIVEDEKNYKHKIVCESCGMVVLRMRESNLTRYPNHYRCKCGGKLIKLY